MTNLPRRDREKKVLRIPDFRSTRLKMPAGFGWPFSATSPKYRRLNVRLSRKRILPAADFENARNRPRWSTISIRARWLWRRDGVGTKFACIPEPAKSDPSTSRCCSVPPESIDPVRIHDQHITMMSQTTKEAFGVFAKSLSLTRSGMSLLSRQ